MANKYLNYDGLRYFWGKIDTAKVDKVEGKGLSTNDYTTDEKTKLAGIAVGAEVNQNAFSQVKVGTTTINSGAKTDTLEFAAGDGVTLTPDATGKKVTINMSGAGSMTGGNVTNSILSGSTLSGTTTAAAGSSLDLDGADSVLVPTAAEGDNTTKAASTAFVKAAVDSAVSTINGTTGGLNTRLGTVEGEIDTLQGAIEVLNGEATVTGSVKKTVADEIAKVVAGADEDFDTLKEVADWIASDTSGAAKMQTDIVNLNTNLSALDAKTVDGPASSTNGTVVLFDGTSGKLIKDSKLTIQKSVPENAVFTDTVYTHPTFTAKDSGLYKITVNGEGHVSDATAVAKSDITALGIPAQDTVYTHPTFTAKDSGLYKITVNGEGHVSAAAAVTKDDITALGIPAQDTTYSAATTSAAGLMSAADKIALNSAATEAITNAEIDTIIAGA